MHLIISFEICKIYKYKKIPPKGYTWIKSYRLLINTWTGVSRIRIQWDYDKFYVTKLTTDEVQLKTEHGFPVKMINQGGFLHLRHTFSQSASPWRHPPKRWVIGFCSGGEYLQHRFPENDHNIWHNCLCRNQTKGSSLIRTSPDFFSGFQDFCPAYKKN